MVGDAEREADRGFSGPGLDGQLGKGLLLVELAGVG